MCKAKPAPRCHGHAVADLTKHHDEHPDLARLTDNELRTAHTAALNSRQPTKARTLAREMDLRLDVDSTKEGIRALHEQVTAAPGDATLWWRYNAAQSTFTAKTEYADAHSPTHGRESNARTLGERRERLARLEGRAAANIVLHGALTEREISALVAEYDAVLECEAAARLVAGGRKPDVTHADPADVRAWRGSLAGVRDGLVHLARGADEFAVRSHRAAAIDTWTYPHRLPARRFDGRRDFAGSPLDGVRVAILTREPVRYENGQVRVESDDNTVRARLWHAGYQLATPVGPIVIRPTGRPHQNAA